MPLLLIILHFLFPWPPGPGEGPDKVISCHYDDVAFSVFCEDLTSRTGVRIFFRDAWVEDVRVTLHNDSITVAGAVASALKGTGLEVSEWHGDLVVMPGTMLPAVLPDYTAGLAPEEGAVPEGNPEPSYLSGRRADVVTTVTIGKRMLKDSNGPVKVRGRITDEETGEPIYGATFFIEDGQAGTTSGPDGSVEVDLRPGKYTARIDYLGYETQKVMLEVLSGGDFYQGMRKAVIQMDEVVVYGDRQMNVRTKDPGLEKISVKVIKQIPMMMGERDIIRVSGMLPGIVTVGEGAAGLNVRGGNSDQNAFYLNKVPVYNTGHLFGFFSAFEADIIRDFSVYKGYIPLEYGGRLSSVFSIATRQGSRTRFGGRGSLSPVAASLTVEGPLKKNASSYMISGRMLYSDWILGQIDDPVIRNSSANFHDFSLSLTQDLKKSQLSVFAYHTYDRVALSDLNTYSYSNNGAALNLSHQFSPSLRAEFSLVGAYYAFNTTDMQEASTAYQHAYGIGHYEARADLKHLLGDKHQLDYGGALTYYHLDRGTVDPYGEGSLRLKTALGIENGMEASVYASDLWQIVPHISLSAGLRFCMFVPVGPSEVLTYAPGGPRDLRYVTDTLHYGKGAPVKWYTEPDIRLALNLETDPSGAVKIAYNQMHQNLFMLSNTVALAPNTQWKLADYHFKPSLSHQVSAGIFRAIRKFGLETSVEGFYKIAGNFPEFIDGADFLESPQVETVVLQGELRSYGVEFLMKKQGRRLEGWISYTWSRSIARIDGEEVWEEINKGKAYPANWDIPHVLNAVVNYHFSRRVTFSTVVAYQTGKPATYPTSIYYVDGVQYVDYSERNAYRIPDYFRIDASLTLEGNLRKKKPLHSSLVLGVYNLTGRENPYSVFFTMESGKIESYQYSVIGVPVFTATWIFKLGNYATE